MYVGISVRSILGKLCATVLFLGLAQSTFVHAKSCGSLCSEAFWQRASADEVEAAHADGTPVDARDEYGATPLHWAAGYGRLPALEALLATGADVHARSYIGFRPLHWWAIWNGAVPVLDALLAAGASIHARDGIGNTPLHEAAERGKLSSVRALIDAGADVNAHASVGGGPLMMAAYRGHLTVVELLLAAGADARQRGAAFAHSEEERIDVTPLHMAASGGAPEVAELLLQHGVDVNATDGYGLTPLDDAIWQEHEAMKALLRLHGGQCQLYC